MLLKSNCISIVIIFFRVTKSSHQVLQIPLGKYKKCEPLIGNLFGVKKQPRKDVKYVNSQFISLFLFHTFLFKRRFTVTHFRVQKENNLLDTEYF